MKEHYRRKSLIKHWYVLYVILFGSGSQEIKLPGTVTSEDVLRCRVILFQRAQVMELLADLTQI